MTAAPADAVRNNWVDRFAPEAARPYLRLMRADRPVGTWLLLLPCWMGLALAVAAGKAPITAAIFPALLFSIGAVVMRGAGCAYNDIVDRDFDAQVARTAARPLAAGQITVRKAWLFLAGLSFAGLFVLLQFNAFSVGLGLASLALVAAYPFMKRVTWWPQAWLGLTFNWGALMGYSALAGGLALEPLLLYAAGVAWTLGYDTIYAHQDKDDDALIGVKSSARKLGASTKPALLAFYGLAIALFFLIGIVVGFGVPFFVALAAPALHFVWQVRRLDIDDPATCLTIFRSNRDAGFLLLAPLCLATALR
jgi:4-hydroxybenzoate polyprenyltransferase